MKLDFVMLADRAALDQAGKLVILGGGVTHIAAPELPFTLESIAVVMRFFLDEDETPGDMEFAIRVDGPDGAPIKQMQAVVPRERMKFHQDHPGEDSTLVVVGLLRDTTFEVPGRHAFVIEMDGRPLATHHVALFREPN